MKSIKTLFSILIVAMLFSTASFGQTLIAYTSFEDSLEDGLSIYTDLGDQTVDHALLNNPGEMIVNYTQWNPEGEIGFSAFYYNTMDGSGLTDGDYVGVTDYASDVTAFSDGNQGYQMSDTDGEVVVSLDVVDVSSYSSTEVKVDMFLPAGGIDNGDSIQVKLVIDGTTTVTLFDNYGHDVDDLDGYGDQWVTIDTLIEGASTLELKLICETNGSNDAVYFDNAKFIGYSDVVPTQVNFASDSYSANEADGSVDLTVTIANPSETDATTVDVVLTSGDAAELGNYTTATVTFPANTTDAQNVTLTINDDDVVGGTENFTFELQNVAGGNSAVIGDGATTALEITDDDFILYDIVFTEIYYNAPGFDDPYEFVELYNNDDVTVDLSGYVMTQGADFVFPEGVSIEPGEFVVIAKDTNTYNMGGYQYFAWEAGDGLNNSGEDIELTDAEGHVVDYVDYQDGDAWPSIADGDGPSLVIVDANADNADPANWRASNFAYGTPGYMEEPIENTSFFTIDVRLRTDNGKKKYLKLGIDPSATNGLDNDLMEAELPPMPPAEIFEARFSLPERTVESYYDYRYGNSETNDSLVHELKWQLGTGNMLYVDFYVPEVPTALTINLQDMFGGAVLDTTSNDSYITFIVSNDALSSANVGIKYEAGVPVELTNFAANVVDAGIELKWTTATEVNNKGFEILRSTDNVNFNTIGFIDGYGTTTEVKNYSFVDANVTGGSYIYKLKQVDYNGTFEYSDAVEVTFAPENFELSQNYPNPFNPSTTISFTVPENVDVKLDVYNTIGQKVTTLVNSVKEAGKYDVKFDASELTSGIYFYVITAGDFKATRKMMLIK